VGTKGKLMCGTYCEKTVLLSFSRNKNITVKQTIAPVPEGQYLQ